MNGAFLIARKSFESELWRNKPSSWWKIWCYILGHVQHKDFKELKRGQGHFNFKKLIEIGVFGRADEENLVTYGMIDKFLRFAKRSNMLSTVRSTRGTLLTVANYDKYQSISTYRVESPVESPVESQSNDGRITVEPINKNEKNEKNAAKPFSKNQQVWNQYSSKYLSPIEGKDLNFVESCRRSFLAKVQHPTENAVRAFIESERKAAPAHEYADDIFERMPIPK